MQTHHSGLQLLLAHWIKSDQLLWKTLKSGFIKLLNQRLIKGYSFEKIAQMNQLEESKVRKIFALALLKLEKSHGEKLVAFIRDFDRVIESKKQHTLAKDPRFEFSRIWLN